MVGVLLDLSLRRESHSIIINKNLRVLVTKTSVYCWVTAAELLVGRESTRRGVVLNSGLGSNGTNLLLGLLLLGVAHGRRTSRDVLNRSSPRRRGILLFDNCGAVALANVRLYRLLLHLWLGSRTLDVLLLSRMA